jgi:Rrf2 family transcriptional regulator, iron-sulfur cluster assembly transcription factor
MKLSTKSRYGTRLMLDLAEQNSERYVQLKEISERQGISLKYLEQIMMALKKARLVESSRGASGGYRLERPADKISVGEIVNTLEAGKTLTQCEVHPESCERADACAVRHLWKEATQAMYDKLAEVCLSDLMSKNNHQARTRLERRQSKGPIGRV